MSKADKQYAALDVDVINPITGRRDYQKNPRIVKIVNTKSGHVIQKLDDGASQSDDGPTPHIRRQQLLGCLAKKDASGYPCFMLAEPVAAIYPGDPVAAAPVVDKKAEAKIRERAAERAAKIAEADTIMRAKQAESIGAQVLAHATGAGNVASVVPSPPSVASPKGARNA